MGMQINTNLSALSAYRNVNVTSGDLNKSIEKLSSGLRINRAADDAAGLAISEGLKSQVGGLKVAARNAQDGISVVQTAEGALGEVQSVLQRLRDLSVQAANDSNNSEARANIQTEATALVSEIDRISKSTNFNGTKLLDGSVASLNFQVGADGDATSRIAVNLTDVSAIADSLSTGNWAGTLTTTPATATGDWVFTQGGTAVTVAMGAADATATNGDLADTLNSSISFAANFTASVDTDGALKVTSKNSSAAITVTGTGQSAIAGAAGAIQFNTHANAQAATEAIDTQISAISTARANLGAQQNRFEHAITNINVGVENLSASQSRIADTDMAEEMVKFTRSQILQQAGTAMLAQANQLPQNVLSLLR
jgi:flagellin